MYKNAYNEKIRTLLAEIHPEVQQSKKINNNKKDLHQNGEDHVGLVHVVKKCRRGKTLLEQYDMLK